MRQWKWQPALSRAIQVRQVLSAPPSALPSDPGEQSKLLKGKLRTGDPVRIAEVVRDLAWCQRRGKASENDLRLLQRADRKLVRWLAAQTGEKRGWTRRSMWGTIERSLSLFI